MGGTKCPRTVPALSELTVRDTARRGSYRQVACWGGRGAHELPHHHDKEEHTNSVVIKSTFLERLP